MTRVRLQRRERVWHALTQVAAVASARRRGNANAEWGVDFSSEVFAEMAEFISSLELLLVLKKTHPLLKFWRKKGAFLLLVCSSGESSDLTLKQGQPSPLTSFSPCPSFSPLLLLASLLLSLKSFPNACTIGYTQVRNEVMFKAGVNVLFWPQMNPVSGHPHAPSVLFHPAKHYPCFVSASITAGWRCSLTQFCHSNLGQPQHFQYYVYFCNSHHFNSRVREPFHVQLCWQNWGGSELRRGLSGAAQGCQGPGQWADHCLKHTINKHGEGQPTSVFWHLETCPLLVTRVGGKYTDFEFHSQAHALLAC